MADSAPAADGGAGSGRLRVGTPSVSVVGETQSQDRDLAGPLRVPLGLADGQMSPRLCCVIYLSLLAGERSWPLLALPDDRDVFGPADSLLQITVRRSLVNSMATAVGDGEWSRHWAVLANPRLGDGRRGATTCGPFGW